MAITKKALKAALADVRAKADEKQKEAQQANYRDDKAAAQYYEGCVAGIYSRRFQSNGRLRANVKVTGAPPTDASKGDDA